MVAPLWPAVMLLTIVSAAHHWVLDAVVGAGVPLLAWRVNEVVLVFRPVEEWLFWVLRTERPVAGEEAAEMEEEGKEMVGGRMA